MGMNKWSLDYCCIYIHAIQFEEEYNHKLRIFFYTTFSVLDVEAFERLLGPCMELMKRNIDDYEDQLVKIFGSKANISDIRWTVREQWYVALLY